MKKESLLLLTPVILGIILGACSSQNSPTKEVPETRDNATNTPGPTLTLEKTVDLVPEQTASLTPEPTLSFTPEFTNTSELPDPTNSPTATEVATLVEEETPTIGSTRTSEIDQMEQVFIPAGEFIMGAEDNDAIQTTDTGRAYPEIPIHTVYLDSYWMDKYEVTNGQYALCVEAGACRSPFAPTSFTRLDYFWNPDFKDYPVIYVDWVMARTYCEWAGRRLPTEAEWEKAARGTEGQKYPWGNEPYSEDRANFCDIDCPRDFANGAYDDGYPDTAPVGSYPAGASPYGVMDMAGNVWEWTGTLIQPYPYDPDDGREDLNAEGERVWRGAAFSNGYWWLRASVRYRSVTFYRYYNLSFRCASSQ